MGLGWGEKMERKVGEWQWQRGEAIFGPCLRSGRKDLQSWLYKALFSLNSWCYLVADSYNYCSGSGTDTCFEDPQRQPEGRNGGVRESGEESGSDWKGRHEMFFWDPGFIHPAWNRVPELHSGCPLAVFHLQSSVNSWEAGLSEPHHCLIILPGPLVPFLCLIRRSHVWLMLSLSDVFFLIISSLYY